MRWRERGRSGRTYGEGRRGLGGNGVEVGEEKSLG